MHAKTCVLSMKQIMWEDQVQFGPRERRKRDKKKVG
jgi:hypothetical protein